MNLSYAGESDAHHMRTGFEKAQPRKRIGANGMGAAAIFSGVKS
jgi:hypothetical protein